MHSTAAASLDSKSSPTDVKESSLGTYPSIFASKTLPTLTTIAAIEIINNFGNVEEAKAFIENNQLVEKHRNLEEAKAFVNLPEKLENLRRETLEILKTIKLFHKYIALNKVREADKLLTETPLYLLPTLLKTKSTVVATAEYMVRGTGLMMAIGFEATGRAGCDVVLMPSEAPLENSRLDKLLLYSNNDAKSPFIYLMNGTVHRIERGEDLIHYKEMCENTRLRHVSFDTLKEMFKNPKFCNQKLNLDHPDLNENQLLAYRKLLEMTRKRKHTLFVNEEGMIEMVQRHIRRALPKNNEGEREISRQIVDQLDENWEEQEDIEFVADFKALTDVRQAISDSKTNKDPALTVALQKFSDHLDSKAKPKEKGRYRNARLLTAALKLGCEKDSEWYVEYDKRKDRDYDYYEYWRKSNLYYDRVIRTIISLEPEHRKQDEMQGVKSIGWGEKSHRSLEYSRDFASTRSEGYFRHFILSNEGGKPIYSIDAYENDYGGHCKAYMSEKVQWDYRKERLLAFQNYIQAKDAAFRCFAPKPRKGPESTCAIQ